MTNSAKNKGDRAELEVQALIRDLTGWPARRKLGAGRLDDEGDIDGVPEHTISVKNYKDFTRGVNEALAGLPDQQKRARSIFGCAFIRRPGGRYVVVMSPEQWATYAREALEVPKRRETA